jgi:hypothetical protein
MSDETIDFDTFTVAQAVWLLVNPDTVGIDSQSCIVRVDASSEILCAGLPVGPTVLIFTDKDLADRQAKLGNLNDLVAATFNSQDEFLKFLQWCKAIGRATHLLFDPGNKPGPKDKLESIERFLQNVKKG